MISLIHAGFSHILALVAEVHEGGHVGVHGEDDVAAPSAVAAVGTASGHIFLPVEGDGAAAARSGPHQDSGGINELIGHGRHLHSIWAEKGQRPFRPDLH